MEKAKWYLKQLLPLTYQSFYRANKERFYCTWKMWMGKVFNVERSRI